MLSTIKRNAMSCWGFPTSPHTCTRERVFSCAFMIACTWKLFTTGQKSCEPHLTLMTISHKLALVERGLKSPIVVCKERKRISQLAGSSTQMPGGDVGCDAWVPSPSHFRWSAHGMYPDKDLSSEGWLKFNLSLCSKKWHDKC